MMPRMSSRLSRESISGVQLADCCTWRTGQYTGRLCMYESACRRRTTQTGPYGTAGYG